jgi:mannose-6-phosphate isomerase
LNAFVGEAIFVEADRASVVAGSRGLKGLLAYVGPAPIPSLLQNLDRQDPASQPARSHDRARIVAQRPAH